eukprot:TRINITY_DN1780_c0_g1_i10.p1 TRINITY_DN1780_c0_g1~~TRINITY_DN1780_c0_g1_i10.p1  ORF type:complete len:242 (-),score=23.93 TRINITY_DN1780_c0_g1_i10:147-872(-)
MSPEFISSRRVNRPASGMYARNAFAILQKLGSVRESLFLYQDRDTKPPKSVKKASKSARIADYAKINSANEDEESAIEIADGQSWKLFTAEHIKMKEDLAAQIEKLEEDKDFRFTEKVDYDLANEYLYYTRKDDDSTDIIDWLDINKIWSKTEYQLDESYKNPDFDRFTQNYYPDILEGWEERDQLQCRISKPQRVSPTVWRSVRTYFVNINYKDARNMTAEEEHGCCGRPWKHFLAGRGQ